MEKPTVETVGIRTIYKGVQYIGRLI
jgi:hypothetical protein